jgi:hypothetical protein
MIFKNVGNFWKYNFLVKRNATIWLLREIDIQFRFDVDNYRTSGAWRVKLGMGIDHTPNYNFCIKYCF